MDFDVLAALPEHVRGRVEQAGTLRRYHRGEVVFHAGDVGESLHFIRTGLAAVRVETAEGDVSIINVLQPGSTFGELALVHPEETRTATIAALTDLVTLSLRRSAFETLRMEHPQVDRLLILALAYHVERLSRLLIEAQREDVPHRLVRRLADLAPSADVLAYSVPLTQEELASVVGTTRPSVNHALKRLTARGLVSLQRGEVTVVDAVALRALCGR